MTITENKALVRQFMEEVFNVKNTDAIADYSVPGSLFAGGLAHQMMVFNTAFPDACSTIDEIVAEADKVVVRATLRAINTGILAGLPTFGKLESPIPPTDQPVMVTGMYVFTIRDDQIMSMAQEFDQIGLLRQLGWTIAPPGSASKKVLDSPVTGDRTL
jgi:predicted ester cyclase